MSQFNSIFSPLSNKLARLAGITLLAVAALFASTQQMSAQISCVQNVTVSLSSVCNDQVTVSMVALGVTTPSNYYVRINDDTPTDDRVNSVSPVTGWTYGLFKVSDNTLVCQGTIIVRDDQAPTFSVAQKAAWEAIDTIVTWADNVDEILNVPQTWFGNTSKYADAPSFGAVKYYTGRPYMTDSCELWRGGVSKADSTWIIDQDGDGLSNRNLNNANNEANGWYFLHRSTNLQIKVTDYYENGQCNNTNVNSPTSGAQGSTNSFHHYLRRSFQFIDQRGNDTTLNQIIYFQRPAPRGTGSDRFANSTTPGSNPQSPLDRGPGNLAQFGPFGDGPRKIHSSYGEGDNLDLVNSSKKIAEFSYEATLGKDQMTGNYSTFSDVIAYNIDQSTTNGGGTCYDFQDSELEKLLSGLYVAVDTLPGGTKDSISLFSKILNSQYSVSFNYKKFPACNNGKKYEVVTTVFDWCSGLQSFDTLVIKMEDNTPPVFTRYNSQANTGTTASSGIKGQTPGDSVIISVGLNDCTANLRLPNKTGSRSDLRDLSALFNLGVYDRCATGSNNTTDRNGNSVTLNYRIQSKDTWNNGFYLPRNEWADVNYTVANLGAGGTPVVMGLPIGEHRIIIEAWDQCSNRSFTTLYFDVQDMVAPTMKCDDQLNVTLTSNSTTNWYINGNGSDVSERELSDDQNARVYVADINEGSKDNCTLDSMYVRRKVSKACIEKYLVWNMDYDVFGDNNGSVTADGDFEKVSGTTDMYYTPKYMQYIEVMCCDGASGSQVMFELWGSDLVQSIPGNSNLNPPASRNWSFCWGNIQIEDKTDPVITAPDLNKPYNTAYDYRDQTKRPVRNWVSCIDKEIIGDPTVVDKNNPKSGDIANEAISNKLFGYPDIYGLECKGKVDYRVIKRLSCDTGVILRIWEVEKEIKPGIKTIKLDTQIIWVQANHNYTIRVPRDIDLECGANISDTKVTYDADGCDLLAISGYNQKVYDAGDGDIACKKVYRTWTVINWCQLPNQFQCNNADPGLYARIIPRLRDLNQLADAQRPAIEIEHRFQKSVSSTARIKGDQKKNGQLWYNYWGLATTASPTWPSAAQTGNTSISHRKAFTTATGYTTSDVTYANPTSNPTCANLNEQTFAWQYTQVIKVSDSKIPDLVRNTAEDLDFTAIDDDGASATSAINWNKNLKVFGIRGKVANSSSTTAQGLTGQECLAKVKFSFNMKDDCGFSGPFSLDKATVVLKNATTPNTTAIGNEQSKSFVWNGGTTTPDNSTNIIVDPIDRGSPNNNGTTTATFNVTIDNLPVKDATDGDTIIGRTTYELLVEVRDDCGNVRVERIDFTVGDIKAPAPVCVSNFQVSLMPTNDGEKDNKGMVRLFARDVFQDINRLWENDECTGPVKARIVRTIEDTATTLAGKKAYGEFIDLNCSDLAAGGRNVRVYLIDAAGNYNYCEINVDIADNAGICADGQSSAAVAGAIQTETKATVEGVQVNLSGQSQKSFATGVNGLFVFNNLTAGADYTVTPSLNKGFLNGVSTFDLVLISKHILGVQPLNTPYKLIAADVNNSKSVTTLDLIQLRKLILNIDATFANNSSWRFVDASYTFPNASNPWAASFPEVKNVNDLVGSLSANFVAVKVGDVNGNAIANSTQGSVRNLTSNLGINVADMNLVAGNEYKVDFTAADLNGIEGFQFTLNLDKKGLELVDLVPGIAAEENFGIFAEEGVVTASWNGEAKGGVLFSLVVRAKSNTTLSEVLNLNSRYTAAEAYKGGEVVNVGLNFNASKASANYELYQNTPNPFAGESIIGFNLPVAGAATLTIQDVTGRTLKVINGQYAKGYNQVSLKSTELSATGVLTYTLKAADFTATRKMIIVE